MKNFSEIIGNKRIMTHLQSAIAMDKPAHAYIFHGDDGCGKRTAAEIFAKGLLCEETGDLAPCGKCRSCYQMESGNHPDFIRVTHEKSLISVEDIRSQLINEMAIRPYSSKYRIFLVDEAEKMNIASQNALLKTLEEPPAYGVIILLSNNVNRFLDTILSRTVTLPFMPVNRDEIVNFLLKEKRIPDYQARIAAACSGGNPGLAYTWVDSETFNAKREENVEILKRIGKNNPEKAIETARALAKNKDDIQFLLRMLQVWIRDVLYVKATNKTSECMFTESLRYIETQAKAVSYEKLGNILEQSEELTRRLDANVNTEISLEMFLMSF